MDGHSDEPLINTRLLRKENGTVHLLTISDLKLLVRKPRGTMVVKDVNCNSTFMLETIREIVTAVCSKFHYLDPFVPIHLFMDNAGGHGTKAVKEEYTEILKNEFNTIVQWQPPNSPELNLLDLGVWVALQSVVEKVHRGKLVNRKLLAETVYEAFGNMDEAVLRNVYRHWLTVMDLIIEGEGSNDLVEQNRGMIRRNPMDDTDDDELMELVALFDEMTLDKDGETRD